MWSPKILTAGVDPDYLAKVGLSSLSSVHLLPFSIISSLDHVGVCFKISFFCVGAGGGGGVALSGLQDLSSPTSD